MADTNEQNARHPQSRNGEHGSKSSRDKRYRDNGSRHTEFDEDINDKLREIESSGEPLSIAEAISHEYGNRLKSGDIDTSSKAFASSKDNDVNGVGIQSTRQSFARLWAFRIPSSAQTSD